MKIMKKVEYRGITFNSYNEDEWGIWAHMCSNCRKKFIQKKRFRWDSKDFAGPSDDRCSVEGCGEEYQNPTKDNLVHFFIFNNQKKIKWLDEGEES